MALSQELRDKAVIIICSRQKSSRLPGKVFRDIAGWPALYHILYRIAPAGIKTVLAVPEGEGAAYAEAAKFGHAEVYEGQGDSPLHRMEGVLRSIANDRDYVIRITHDDILIDLETMMYLLEKVSKTSDCGYGYTPSILNGAGVEVIHRSNILEAAFWNKRPTEFISYFVKGAGGMKGILQEQPRKSIARPAYRLTMDYPEDAQLLDLVLSKTRSIQASCDDVVSYLDRHPSLLNINRQPLVTFYTCVHNGARWLREAIQSVVGCGIDDFEYIIVDDGSTDDTAAIAAEFVTDRRVRLLTSRINTGLASASNKALDAARGRWVMRVDADDRLSVDFFKGFFRMAERLDRGARVVYPAFTCIDEEGEVLEHGRDPKESHHVGGALFDRALINELRFKDGIRHYDGLELYKRMQKNNVEVAYCPTISTWQYRQHSKSLSRSEPAERAAIKETILRGDEHRGSA